MSTIWDQLRSADCMNLCLSDNQTFSGYRCRIWSESETKYRPSLHHTFLCSVTWSRTKVPLGAGRFRIWAEWMLFMLIECSFIKRGWRFTAQKPEKPSSKSPRITFRHDVPAIGSETWAMLNNPQPQRDVFTTRHKNLHQAVTWLNQTSSRSRFRFTNTFHKSLLKSLINVHKHLTDPHL